MKGDSLVYDYHTILINNIMGYPFDVPWIILRLLRCVLFKPDSHHKLFFSNVERNVCHSSNLLVHVDGGIIPLNQVLKLHQAIQEGKVDDQN